MLDSDGNAGYSIRFPVWFLVCLFSLKSCFSFFSLELFNLRTEVGNDFCSLCSWAGRKNATNFLGIYTSIWQISLDVRWFATIALQVKPFVSQHVFCLTATLKREPRVRKKEKERKRACYKMHINRQQVWRDWHHIDYIKYVQPNSTTLIVLLTVGSSLSASLSLSLSSPFSAFYSLVTFSLCLALSPCLVAIKMI